MIEKVKKYGVIAIIAILFALFAFSIVDVVEESPKYENYCGSDAMPVRPLQKELNCPGFIEPTADERERCSLSKGDIIYNYDANGCPTSFECNPCRGKFEEASKGHRLIGFIITSIFGVVAILIGLFVKSKEDVVEWIYSGILIGGILSIVFGTMSYFADMGRFVKPIVLLVEMLLIILIAIKTVKKK